MDFKGNLDTLMEEAQKMQEKMKDAQDKLTEIEVTGESGAGMVKVLMRGNHDCRKVSIKPTAIDEDDPGMLEDLVQAAINDAVQKIEKQSKDMISDLTASMQLPEDFGDVGDGGNEQ